MHTRATNLSVLDPTWFYTSLAWAARQSIRAQHQIEGIGIRSELGSSRRVGWGWRGVRWQEAGALC